MKYILKMKSKLTVIILALLLSSCMEGKYNKLTWENSMQDEKIEILRKQITIDSLERVLHEYNDTISMQIDTIRMPYLMRDTVFINDTIVRVEIQRYTPFKN